MAINIDTNTDGDVTYKNPPVNRVLFPNITDHATPEEIQAAVDAWLEDHPEATTTVQDGSILPVKLDSSNDAADGYVLSWNATDEQFEWVNVQADIDDLKQDLDAVPSNKLSVSTQIVERNAENIKVNTVLSNNEKFFTCLPIQYDYLEQYSGSGYNYRYLDYFIFSSPLEYQSSDPQKVKPYILFKTSPTYELLTYESTGYTLVKPNFINGRYQLKVTLKQSDYTSGSLIYKMARPCYGILDSSGNIIDMVYGSQVNHKIASLNPSTLEPINPLNEITSADTNPYNVIHKANLCCIIVGANDILNFTATNITSLVNNLTATNSADPANATVDYSAIQSKPKIFARLYVGDRYVDSNFLVVDIPDMIVKSSISSGDTFMLGDLWYKATTDLAIGDTLVVGTNCEAIDEPVIPTEELPTIPTTDGTYHLEVSVASGVPTMTWVANA